MTKSAHFRKRPNGFTIVEVTLVLSIILGLVLLLFLGLSAYKNGSDKARCVLQLAAIQKSARSCQNTDDLVPGDAMPTTYLQTEIYLPNNLPVCPKDGSAYNYSGTVTDPGVAYATCNNAALAGNLSHAPAAATLADW